MLFYLQSGKNTGWHMTEQPEILPGIQNMTVYTHDRVVLKCTARNRRTKDVSLQNVMIQTTYY